MIGRSPWHDDDELSDALMHRRLQLTAVLAAAVEHDQQHELERELAMLDADLAAGVGKLHPDRREELRRRYLQR